MRTDGLFYTSRFNGRECVALFDQAADAIAGTGVTDVALTTELATEFAQLWQTL